MLYTKPKGVRYTDMAIYIDEHVYNENKTLEEEATIYEYLYHLVNMLAHKHNYFKTAEDYDNFAVELSNQLYYRLINPKQFEYDENGEPKLARIKSILNYIKAIIYGRKVLFQQNNYSQVIDYNKLLESEYDLEYSFEELVNNSLSDLKSIDVEVYFDHMSCSIKNFVEKLPYKSDKIMLKNIYLSVLLSLNNMITLKPSDKELIENCKRNSTAQLNLMSRCYAQQKDSSIILYHLKDDMYDYIRVLINKIKRLIINDLNELTQDTTTIDNAMKSFIFAELNNESEYLE